MIQNSNYKKQNTLSAIWSYRFFILSSIKTEYRTRFARKSAYYFENNNNPKVIVKSIKNWLKLYETNSHPRSDKMPWLTWKESAEQLMNRMKR